MTAPQQRPPADPWGPGFWVGDYAIDGRLGAGGMGVVYRAHHRATGVPCALKTTPLGGDPEAVLRFAREGQAQARVDAHRNVVKVHTAGHTDGRAYLVMDLVDGGDLSQRLRKGPLPAREAARVVRDLARGLAHVHAQGVLHRDLKPANVLFDADGNAKLVDFGLASVQGSDTLTQSGTVLGSPTYMAPEQAMGKRDSIGVRSDVYGLGAVLYAALTARPPFDGASVLTVLCKVCEQAPEPLSTFAPVPPALEALCLRALAKSPEDRYASAEELADALDGFLRGERAGRPWRAPAAGLGLALALAVALAALGQRPAGEAPSVVAPPEVVGTVPEAYRELLNLKGIAALRAQDAFLAQTPRGRWAADVRRRRAEAIRKPLLTLSSSEVRKAYFSPDGSRVVVRTQTRRADEDTGGLELYSLDGTRREQIVISGLTNVVVLDPRRPSLVAVADERGRVFKVDRSTGEQTKRTIANTALYAMSLTDDGAELVVCGRSALEPDGAPLPAPLHRFAWPSLAPLPPLPANGRTLIDHLRSGAGGRLYAAVAKNGARHLEVLGPDGDSLNLLALPSAATAIDVSDSGPVALGFGTGALRLYPASFLGDRLGVSSLPTLTPPATSTFRYFPHTDKVFGLTFDPGGRWLYSSNASTTSMNDLLRWDLARPQRPAQRARIPFEQGARSLSCDPSGDLLLVCLGAGEGVEVWHVDGLWPPEEAPSPARLAELEGATGVDGLKACEEFLLDHPKHPQAPDVARQRARLVREPLTTIDEPGVSRVLFGTAAAPLLTLDIAKQRLSSYAHDGTPGLSVAIGRPWNWEIDREGNRVVVSGESWLGLYSLDGGAELARVSAPDSPMHHLALVPSEGLLVAGGGEVLRAFRWPSLTPLANALRPFTGAGIKAIEFVPEHEQILIAATEASGGASLDVYDAVGGRPESTGIPPAPTAIRVANGGKLVALGSSNGDLNLVRIGGGVVAAYLPPPASGRRDLFPFFGLVRSVAFSPSGEYLYAACDGGAPGVGANLCRWRVGDPASGQRAKLVTGAIRDMALSADGSLMALALREKTVEVWHVDAFWPPER